MMGMLSAWLREQRLARGWSVAEMGRQLQKAAKTSGDHTVPRTAILASYVRRWEADRIGVTERYRLHYCAAFGIAPNQFGPRAPDTQLPRTTGHPAGMGTGDVAAPLTADAEPGTEVLDRRGEPSGYRGTRGGHNATDLTEQPTLAALHLDQLTAAIADESLGFGEWVGMSEVADATIEQYASQARRLAKVFEVEMSVALLLETRRLRDRVASQLRGHQRIGQARDLYLVAAQVCGLLAWMSGDAGNYRAGDTHAWTAWMCAEQAGHDGARAWVRATQAKLAYWDGRYGESAQLAEDGLGYGPAGSAHVFLALFRARALARTGRVDLAAQALSQAAANQEAAAGPDLLGGPWELTPGRYHGLLSGIRLLMGNPGDAVAEASQAITLSQETPLDERHLFAEFLVRTDQAQAYVQRSELDGVTDALRPVLDLPADMRTEPIVQQLGRLRASLAAPAFATASQARDLQDEIEVYDREALARQLSE
jgi:transcriptional regulator with XRE-family HTH domain